LGGGEYFLLGFADSCFAGSYTEDICREPSRSRQHDGESFRKLNPCREELFLWAVDDQKEGRNGENSDFAQP
jgi:hypothetical protein